MNYSEEKIVLLLSYDDASYLFTVVSNIQAQRVVNQRNETKVTFDTFYFYSFKFSYKTSNYWRSFTRLSIRESAYIRFKKPNYSLNQSRCISIIKRKYIQPCYYSRILSILTTFKMENSFSAYITIPHMIKNFVQRGRDFHCV